MQTKKRAKPVEFGEKEKENKNTASKKPHEIESGAKAEEVKEVVEAPEIKSTLESAPSVNLNEASVVDSEKDMEKTSENDQKLEKPFEEKTIKEDESEPEEFFSLPPDKYDNKKSILPYFLLVTFITFLLSLAFFYGIYYAVNSKPKVKIPEKEIIEVTTTPVTTVPTKKPLDLSINSITILNGTNVAGTAAKLKAILEDAGFKVGTVGNADTDDFIKTVISFKKTVNKEYVEKLKEVLNKSYQLGSTEIISSGAADVVITIGSASAK